MILTTAIIKGGTGKSTTAAALAQAARSDKKKVLAIDLDPQANLTYFLGADQNQTGAYDLLEGQPLPDCIQNTEQGIDCVAASPDLATEKTAPGSAKRLHNALKDHESKYDLIIIDTPPSLGELLYNALTASTGLVIPLETDAACLQGLYQIADIARQIGEKNDRLKISGVIVTRYDARPKINRYMLDVIKQRSKDNEVPFLGIVRNGITIREAQATQESLFTYDRKSKPTQDYSEIYKKLFKKKK